MRILGCSIAVPALQDSPLSPQNKEQPWALCWPGRGAEVQLKPYRVLWAWGEH